MKVLYTNIIPLFFIFLAMASCKKDDSDDSANDPKAENLKALGVSAEDILSEDIYKTLTVEFVYSPAYRPSQEAIDQFRTFLTERVNKPSGITIIETVINDQSGVPFTIEEIRAIEDAQRTRYTVGDNIAVYVYFSNGSSQGDTNTSVTLGTAYRNTSLVIYEKTLQDITSSDPSLLPALESTTLQHEFGHILGLVNIQDDDIHPSDHEDPLHLKHCIVEDCLMYFEATNTRAAVERLRSRRMVPTLDPLCIADLQSKGGK